MKFAYFVLQIIWRNAMLRLCSSSDLYILLNFFLEVWINQLSDLYQVFLLLKEKLPQAFMQIGWMEDDFRNLTANVWANLDNPTKRYDFSKVSLILCMSPSQVVTTVQLSNGTIHKFFTKFYLSWKCIFPLLLYLGMLGLNLKWMCMHKWMNLIKRTIDIQEKLKMLKIYVQSQWRVVLLWYDIFWQSSIQRGDIHNFCIITSLKWIIQICSNFYCWVCKIAFYSPNPHCCLGKLPL